MVFVFFEDFGFKLQYGLERSFAASSSLFSSIPQAQIPFSWEDPFSTVLADKDDIKDLLF